MNQPKARLGEDKVLVTLERGHLWFEDHWKKLAILMVVSLAVALVYAYISGQKQARQMDLWNEASSKKTIDEKNAFVAAHPDSQAARPMFIMLAREELDKGMYEKARDHLNVFISRYPNDPLLGSAHLLRGYAHEEMGKIDEARGDYEKSSLLTGISKALADLALARLKQK